MHWINAHHLDTSAVEKASLLDWEGPSRLKKVVSVHTPKWTGSLSHRRGLLQGVQVKRQGGPYVLPLDLPCISFLLQNMLPICYINILNRAGEEWTAKVIEVDRTAVTQCREARPAQSSAAMPVQFCGWPGVATGHGGLAAHELAILPTSLPLCRAVFPALRAQSGEQ